MNCIFIRFLEFQHLRLLSISLLTKNFLTLWQLVVTTLRDTGPMKVANIISAYIMQFIYRMAVGAVQAAQASIVLGVLQWMQVKLWICSL